jgi:plastocyanin
MTATTSPPPGPGQNVVEIAAGDYAFAFDRTAITSGDFAIRFVNGGTEAHEITMFRAPADVPVADAAVALGDVDGGALDNVPAPFELVDHLTFAEPGSSVDFQFAEPLAPGHYVIVCYIPQGTITQDDLEEPAAGAVPHVKLGMIADFTVDG